MAWVILCYIREEKKKHTPDHSLEKASEFLVSKTAKNQEGR
jgi:hypothetical protein